MHGLIGYKSNRQYEIWVFDTGVVVKKFHNSKKPVFFWWPEIGAEAFMAFNRSIRRV